MLKLSNLAVFDSKGPGRHFVCLPISESHRPQFLAPELVIDIKVNFVNWDRESAFSTCLLWFRSKWLRTFCNGTYHYRRSNWESVDQLGFRHTGIPSHFTRYQIHLGLGFNHDLEYTSTDCGKVLCPVAMSHRWCI